MSEKRPKSGEFAMAPGRIYPTSNPEFLGKQPVRSPLTVLAATEANTLKLGWTVQEYNGGAVSRIDDKNEVVEATVTGTDALKEGDRILAPTLMGEVMAVVARDGVGDLCWVSGGFVGDLEYDKKRKYWITSVAINKKLLT